MNREILFEAQGFLTVKDGIRERKITDLVALSRNHDTDELILFLSDLYFDKHRMVSGFLERYDNSIMLDMTIGAMFRLSQAIRLIKNSRKEDIDDHFEQKTGTSG
jgi:hypothetical protein